MARLSFIKITKSFEPLNRPPRDSARFRIRRTPAASGEAGFCRAPEGLRRRSIQYRSGREPLAFPLELIQGAAVPDETTGPEQEVQRKPDFNQAHEQIEMSTGLQIVEKMERHHQADYQYYYPKSQQYR